jgi:hypothetical protein
LALPLHPAARAATATSEVAVASRRAEVFRRIMEFLLG